MLLRDLPAGRVRNLAAMLFLNHLATAALDHLASLLRHQFAGGVRDVLDVLFGDHRATGLLNHVAVLFRYGVASGVRDVLDVLFGNHRAARLPDHVAMRFRHHMAGGVRDALDLLFGDHVAAAAVDHIAMVLAFHATGRVRDALDFLFRNHRAARLLDHVAMRFGNHVASRVALLPHDGVRLDAADRVRAGVELLVGHVMAAAHRADFLVRHPNAVTFVMAGALDLVVHSRAWAVVRRAGAGVEGAATRHPAALVNDRAGAVILHRFIAAGADFDAFLRVNRLASRGFVAVAARLLHSAIAGLRDLTSVLFIDRL